MPVDWQLLFKGIFFYGIGAVLHILLRKNRRQYISHESVWVLQQERTRALCWGLYNHTFCENFYERYPIRPPSFNGLDGARSTSSSITWEKKSDQDHPCGSTFIARNASSSPGSGISWPLSFM